MRTHELSPSIFRYVMAVFKGKGKALGEIASEARSFESDLNCWIDMIEAEEGLRR